MNSFAIFLSFALRSCQKSQAATAAWKQLGCDCIWQYATMYLLCVCPQRNILNEQILAVPISPILFLGFHCIIKKLNNKFKKGLSNTLTNLCMALYCIVFT